MFRVFFRRLTVLGQRFHQVVKTQPDAPTVVVESDGENERYRKECIEHILKVIND